jgi:hygromycin-B 7''-O-kinase
VAFSDSYHQPDAADPVLEAAAVLALVGTHVPDVRAVTDIDESGGEARVYVVDHEVILKTQRPHRVRARTSLAKEAFFLEHLASVERGIPVPRVLGSGNTGGIDYLVMTRIRGAALARSTVEPEARHAALRTAGRLLRRIHGVDQTPLADSGLFPGDSTPEDLPGRVGSALRRLLPGLAAKAGWPSGLVPEQVVQAAVAATPTDTHPVALHSNPGPEHVFIDPTSAEFTGLIDFGDAYRSHPAFDPRTWVSRGDSEALLAGYAETGGLSDTFMAAWRLGLVIQECTFATYGLRSVETAGIAIAELLEQLG